MEYEEFLLRGEALPAANALIVPSFESNSAWTSVWAHEYFHFLQLVGTRTGQLISFIYAFLGHSVGAFLREPPDIMRNTPIWYFPLLKWCAIEKNESLHDCLRKHFGHLLLETHTLKLILGVPPLILAEGNYWKDKNLFPYRITLPPVSEVLPVVDIRDKNESEYLGAWNIMETAAAIQGLRMESEISFDNNRLGFDLPEKQRQILKRMPKQYSAALRFVEKHTDIDQYLSISVTMLAADIALNSGVGDQGARLPWEDWHPGWRFVKAVEAIEDMIDKEGAWPTKDRELSNFIRRIEDRCQWKHTEACPPQKLPLYVFFENPSPADLVRMSDAKKAAELRKSRESLWSVGPREQIIDASLRFFPPPITMHYGRQSVRGRADLSIVEIGNLWNEGQVFHIAWQILGDVNSTSGRRIECFYWAKEGLGTSCPDFNGHCRWFPSYDDIGSPPDSCSMVETLKTIAGPYWERLTPL